MNVCLVSMPAARPEYPSCALATLKSKLKMSDIETCVIYGNHIFYELILRRLELDSIPNMIYFEVIEGLFSCYLNSNEKNNKGFLDITKYYEVKEEFSADEVSLLKSIYDMIPEFIDLLVSEISALNIDIVGCTSVFNQKFSSLLLMKELKKKNKGITTFVGGFDYYGEKGKKSHSKYKFIDCAISGEGEKDIVEIIRLLYSKEYIITGTRMDGVYFPSNRDDMYSKIGLYTKGENDLDLLPIPNYDDFFKSLESTMYLKKYIEPRIIIETSRGCWWKFCNGGCNFCGIDNNISEGYRIKSPERVISEIKYLADRYQLNSFFAADEVLPKEFYKSVFPRMIQEGIFIDIYYELRADTTHIEMTLLRKLGVKRVQAGIESLNSSMLKNMNKGMKLWQNIRFLRCCKENNIKADWNMMVLCVGDKPSWYKDLIKLISYVTHLQPPTNSINQFQLVKNSNYYRNADNFGIVSSIREIDKLIYNLPEDELEPYVHSFNYEYINNDDKAINAMNKYQVSKLRTVIKKWTHIYVNDNSELYHIINDENMCIYDKRIFLDDTKRPPKIFELNNVEKKIYCECIYGTREDNIYKKFSRKSILFVEYLIENKLIIRDNDVLIALSVNGQIA